MSQEWLQDEDPSRLAVRVERVLVYLSEAIGSSCATCERDLCGHFALLSLVAGYEDRPLCLDCLATELGRDAEAARDEMVAFAFSKECLVHGWRLASLREEVEGPGFPPCLGGGEVPPSSQPAAAPEASEEIRPDASWDAGDLGCGELVLKLKMKLRGLSPGSVLALRATDPGAPEDIPAWCRLTGNPLMQSNHPDYFIKRKD